MKTPTQKRNLGWLCLLSTLTLFFSAGSHAAGLLKPVNSALPDLQIREHHVEVIIDNGYITTQVEQVFHNPSAQQLEAIYSFPVPEKAAVGEFTYWIDGQPVTAEVVEKQKAKQIYQQEKQAGREAALVEKDAYKTFDINVTPVQANSDVRIRLVYIQAADIDHSIGRYVYPLEEGGVDEQKLSFWTRNETVTEKFSFKLKLRSGYPLDSIRLPKHPQAIIQSSSEQEWRVSLVNQQQQESEGASTTHSGTVASLDQDILVYWRLKENLPGALDMVSYREPGKSQGTFMLTLTPGDDLPPLNQGGDWIFVLDVSGSMQGKYATLADGVRQALQKLRQQDRFRVVVFNEKSRDISGGFQYATPENTQQMLSTLENFKPGGGTNLYAGLEKGLDKLDADRSASIILVTDGVANVGVTEKKTFIKLLKKNDIRLFTFIMGNSANRPMLQEMTDVSQGFAVSVSNADDIVGKIMQATSKMTHQALRDVKLDIDGVSIKQVSPENIGSLYRGQQLVVFGHYSKAGTATVTLSGKVGSEKRVYSTQVNFPDTDTNHPELERLWAYGFIEQSQSQLDYYGADADIEQAITDVAIQYGLVTDYTSMLVVREEVFQQLNIQRNNKQRVEKEQLARENRAQLPVASQRVDQQQPMFNQPRSSVSSGGSGSFDLWMMLALLGLLAAGLYRPRHHSK